MITINTSPEKTYATPLELPTSIAGELFLDADDDLFLGTSNHDLIGLFHDGGTCASSSAAWPLRRAPAGTTVTITQG